MNTEYKGGFSYYILKAIKIIFLYPLAFGLTMAGFMLAGEGFMILSACISEGYMAWSCIMTNIFTGLCKIGAGSVVGARAVVTHDVPPNSLVVGNPARVIRENVEWKY